MTLSGHPLPPRAQGAREAPQVYRLALRTEWGKMKPYYSSPLICVLALEPSRVWPFPYRLRLALKPRHLDTWKDLTKASCGRPGSMSSPRSMRVTPSSQELQHESPEPVCLLRAMHAGGASSKAMAFARWYCRSQKANPLSSFRLHEPRFGVVSIAEIELPGRADNNWTTSLSMASRR